MLGKGKQHAVSWHVLLYGHNFDNAGSSLDQRLHRRFGEGFTDHRDNEAMREAALSTLDGMPAVGLMERNEKSSVSFEDFLKPIFAGLELSDHAVNTSDAMALESAKKKEGALSELEPVRDDFIATNKYDLRRNAQVNG